MVNKYLYVSIGLNSFQSSFFYFHPTALLACRDYVHAEHDALSRRAHEYEWGDGREFTLLSFQVFKILLPLPPLWYVATRSLHNQVIHFPPPEF